MTGQPASSFGRGIPGWLVKTLTSGLLLLAVLHWVPIEDIAASLRGVDPGWVLLGYALTIPCQLLSVWQIHFLFKAAKSTIRFPRLLWIHLTTEFWGLVMPGYLSGGVLRFYRATEPHDLALHIE